MSVKPLVLLLVFFLGLVALLFSHVVRGKPKVPEIPDEVA